MDQFEAARLKAQKNRERMSKYSTPQPVEVPVVEAPKEKEKDPGNGATITVSVQLPDQSYSMKFSKPAVYQNAIKSKLTKQAIANAVKDGLRPLLGTVNEV